MTAQIKRLQEQLVYPSSPTRLHKIESNGVIRPQDFAIKQRGANGNIGHNRGPAIKPGTMKRMHSSQFDLSQAAKIRPPAKDAVAQFDYDHHLKDFQDSALQASKPEKQIKSSSPPKQAIPGKEGRAFSFKILSPPKLSEKDLNVPSRIAAGGASPNGSKLSVATTVSAPLSKMSSPFLGPSSTATRQPIRSPSRTSFRLRDSSGSLQPRLEKSNERQETSNSEAFLQLPSESLNNAKSPKSKGFSIKKQLTTMFSAERTKVHCSSQLPSNFTSQANLVIGAQQPVEPKVAFKYDMFSMTGFSTDSEKVNQDYARAHSFFIGSEKKEVIKIFALADGHGTNGALASKLATDNLISSLEKKFARPLLSPQSSDQSDQESLVEQETTLILQQCFAETHSVLKQDSERRFKYSGTTLVCILVRKNILFFCNVGDSKGILCSRGSNPKEVVCSIETKCHKPDDVQERSRIEAAGGIVVESIDEISREVNGPPRVWNKAKTEPGLATSRSIGDIIAHNLGVSDLPGNKLAYHRYHNKEGRSFIRQVYGASIRWSLGFLRFEGRNRKMYSIHPYNESRECCQKDRQGRGGSLVQRTRQQR
jgi:serine/threonine protein phosphatase PrpC